jgi:hypothetical protein
MLPRKRIVAECQWAVDHADQIGYVDPSPRPMLTLPRWAFHTLPIDPADCSETVTGIYYAAGAPDPNGRGYDRTGNTRVMLAANMRIAPSQVKRGDIGLFVDATGTATHAIIAMVDGGGQVFTHGSPSGPHIYPLTQEQGYHPDETLVWVRVAS